ncbi:MAG: DUF2953 domain-containing protein [Clostridia bacterium]|nr:DUF2953 domain-containing protein [Clostridia bacterium]
MTALYILLGIIALIAAILCLTVGVRFKYDSDTLCVKLILGIFEIGIMPKKKKFKGTKKLSRKLKGKKISQMTFEDKKKEKETHKKEKKLKTKFERTGNTVDDFISAVSEMTNSPEALRLLLTALRNLAKDFKKSLKIRIFSLKASIDTGDAAETCICCGAISQLTEYFLEFAGNYTCLYPVEKGSVCISPVFDGSGNRFDISFKIKIRIFSVVKAFISSIKDNIKIQKQYLPVKERTEK